MPNVTRPTDSTTDPLPPPEVTPCFRRVAESRRRELDLAAARRGLPPEPWKPWAA